MFELSLLKINIEETSAPLTTEFPQPAKHYRKDAVK